MNSKLNICLFTTFCLYLVVHMDLVTVEMKAKKQSLSDKHDDKLTIEDVIQLGGDQVRVLQDLFYYQ